ncbi:MAG: type II toxin-antitoxin system Phd/YefM family antitoxin, partial [Clostridium sp.]|nr:type II toxin-antitoxin system Phd/YefM family antitoxin [Clostridium sp.]MCM1172909.1 type II toxin-antitoxin system Phd/YefM family antitoxin [Clostridium sp.]
MSLLRVIIEGIIIQRNDYASISALAKETKEPTYITKNGEGDMVLISIDAFEKWEQEDEMRIGICDDEKDAI